MHRSLGILIVVAPAMAGAGCQAGTTAAAELKVGDCFDVTPSVDANGDNTTSNVVTDCAKPHDAEVYLVFDVPVSPSGYPGDEAIGALQQTRCDAAFTTFVGKDSGLSSYTIDYVRPDANTWSHGDRSIACLIEDGLGGKLTGSAKGTKR